MPPRRTLPVTVILTAALLSACTPPNAPTPAPTPTPTFSCVPEAGGEPVPCGPIEYEQAQKRDALYAEAEGVFRRYWAELGRLSLERRPEFTPELEATTAGSFAKETQESLLPSRHALRVEGEAPIRRIARVQGLSKGGSEVTLLVCIDASMAKFESAAGVVGPGVPFEERVFLSRAQDSLKITEAESRDVPSC